MACCARQLDDYIQHYGVKNFYEVITSLMDQLRDEPLNVAVLGKRRQDKQLFLQAMCKNLAFNRGGLHRSSFSHKAASSANNLQLPGSGGSRGGSANNSFNDVNAYFQSTGSSWNSGVIWEERESNATLLEKTGSSTPSSRSDYGTGGAHTPPGKDACTPSMDSSEQDEGVFVNEDAEGCDAEVAQLMMAMQQIEVYTEDNQSDILTYRYPEYPDIRFWDIPDFEAEGYSKHTYQEEIKHALDFDAFLVTSGNRFLHPDDLWWAELFQKERGAVFVCTHLDREINRQKQTDSSVVPSDHSAFRRVHSYYRKKFFKHSLFGLPLFIVSPSEGMKFDFPELTRLLLKWKERKQRGRKTKLYSAALEAVQTKHDCLQSTHRLVSIVTGLAAGLSPTLIFPVAGDILLYFMRCLSKQSFGLDNADLDELEVKEEEEEESVSKSPKLNLNFSSLLGLAPCTVTWFLHNALGKIITWSSPEVEPEVVTTSLSLVGVGVACLWSQSMIANQLTEDKEKCKTVVEYMINRKLVTYLKQTGDIGSTTTGTRTGSPVSFTV